VAVPYGELSSKQIRVLANIARDYDRPDDALFANAQATQNAIDPMNPTKRGMKAVFSPPLTKGYAHFTTRQNVQFNWIRLSDSADVMDLLASVDMHGIQTSGNCIRNITIDELAGVEIDEIADPRAFGEILRQWSRLHPEFAYLPRKFKIAISGAKEARAATAWHDVGLFLEKNALGELGFKVLVGGGMGRTPITGSVICDFLPWNQIINYLEAIVRVYNRFGRRDNIYIAFRQDSNYFRWCRKTWFVDRPCNRRLIQASYFWNRRWSCCSSQRGIHTDRSKRFAHNCCSC
jgi:sulfite reductase (NADPH) hemoprotein beta-component